MLASGLISLSLLLIVLTIIVTLIKMRTLKLVRIRLGDGSSIWNAPRLFGWTIPVIQVGFLFVAGRQVWLDIGSRDDSVGYTLLIWTNVSVAILFLSQLLLLRGSRSA